MLRGYYTAASGIVTQEKKLNTYSNNIANVSTVGYKKDSMISGDFGEHLAVRMNAYQSGTTHEIGNGVFMQVIDEKYTDYTQGAFENTQRPMDMCIAGEGFFSIQKDDGEYLTRDGQFSLDDAGYLTLPGFGRVLGQNGEIEIGSSTFSVDRQGNVYVLPFDAAEGDEPDMIDTLKIVVPDDMNALDKAQDGLYWAESSTQVDFSNTQVLQGTLERSNVNMSEEMTRVISSQRALQTCSQIVKMYDDLAERITTQISRV